MFCPNCGQSLADSARFCPNCGRELTPPPPPAPDFNGEEAAPAAVAGEGQRLRAVFAQPMFLAITILFLCATALGLFAGEFDVLSILFCIGLCMTCYAARSAAFNTKGLRLNKGVTTAMWVLMWVAFVFLLVAAMLMLVAVLFGAGSLVYSFSGVPAFSPFDGFAGLPHELAYHASASGGILTAGLLIGLLFMFLVMAVVLLLVNLFFVRSLRRFTASVVLSAESDAPRYEKANAVRIWLMVLGIIACLSIFGLASTASVRDTVSSAIDAFGLNGVPGLSVAVSRTAAFTRYLSTCSSVLKGVTMILCSVFIGKHFR